MSDKRALGVPRVVPPQQYRVAEECALACLPVLFQPRHIAKVIAQACAKHADQGEEKGSRHHQSRQFPVG
jgi:hypothetical protein